MSLLVPTRIYARKGERVVCSGGLDHHICTVAKDIPVGARFDRAYFEDWKQPEPLIGQTPPHCRICDAQWCVWKDGGPLLHFWDGGWRWAVQGF